MKKGLFVLIAMLILSTEVSGNNWTLYPKPSNKIRCLESTPEGIVAGEFDDRMWLNPYNGVYLSRDDGLTWQKIGMVGRGIISLKYKESVLMAAAYYTTNIPRGLYISQYPYESWQHIGSFYDVTAMDKCGEYFYMGTTNHGLSVSEDGGETWEQRIGSGWEGPEIITIYCNENIVLASGRTTVYSSTDKGETWATIPFFDSNTVYSFSAYSGGLAASGAKSDGIYISSDGGINWSLVEINGYRRSKSIVGNGQYLYIANAADVMASLNSGQDALGTGLSAINSMDLLDMAIHKPSSYKIIALNSSGELFQRPTDSFMYNPFLSPPWHISEDSELFENINSYFDHAFPLLAYPYKSEPPDESLTTLKYDGVRGSQPGVYYSSHSGIDFDMEYGDPVLAAADGIATYYYCTDCGHSVKITHPNGYQTIYMHLQEDTVVSGTATAQITTGLQIGSVGMTGRTTGPHLHFEVLADTDQDGLFSDEFPRGRTDPFGWDYSRFNDPWSALTWTDVMGTHTGAVSKTLWTMLYPGKQEVLLEEGNTLTAGNKLFKILQDAGEKFLNLVFEYAPAPANAIQTSGAEFVKGTSFILNTVDQLGGISASDAVVMVKINLTPEYLVGFIPETLKIYRWAEETSSWVETVSHYDTALGVIEGVLDHFSYFAVFGEKTEEEKIFTELQILPEPVEGHVLSSPNISFTTNGSLTLYSIDGGLMWQTYTEPFVVTASGMFDILYKSRGNDSSWEETKSFVLTVGSDLSTTKIRVRGAVFETALVLEP